MKIFLDLQTARIIHAVRGRSKHDINPFLKLVARKAKHLKAVAMNMSRSYSSAVTEQLRLLWDQPNRKQATRFLDQWCLDALAAGPKPLIKVGLMLLKHKTGILNYFAHSITSGSVEGTVNKIKTLKRQAYDFRDMKYFKLRLYHLHRQGYSLTV